MLLSGAGIIEFCSGMYAEVSIDISCMDTDKNDLVNEGKFPPSVRSISEITRNYTKFILDNSEVNKAKKVSFRLAKMIEKGDTGTLLDGIYDALTFGQIALVEEDWECATLLIDRAIDGARTVGHVVFLAECLIVRATLCRKLRSFIDADYYLREAIRISTKEHGKLRLWECDAYLEYSRMALVQDEHVTARDYLSRAKQLVIETSYLRRARDLRALKVALS